MKNAPITDIDKFIEILTLELSLNFEVSSSKFFKEFELQWTLKGFDLQT